MSRIAARRFAPAPLALPTPPSRLAPPEQASRPARRRRAVAERSPSLSFQPRPSVLGVSPRRLVRGISPPRFARRHSQPPPLSLYPRSHPTPPPSDRLEPCSATPRPFGHLSRLHPVPLATRYRPLIRQESTGARPVLRTGRRALFRRARLRPARLHEARYAVFALRVTIPAAYARCRSLRASLASAVAKPVHDRRRGSVAALPTPAALSNLRDTRITARRFAPPPLALASPPSGGSRSPSASQQARRYRAIAVARPLSLYPPHRKSATAHRSPSDIALPRPALRALALRTGRCLPPKPWHSPRTSRPYGQAARPCRGMPSDFSPRSRCLVLSALRASAPP